MIISRTAAYKAGGGADTPSVYSLHELRFARWSEIDFRHKIWTIPATRETIEKVRFSGRGAKMRTPHIVPLSWQSIAILKQIQEISGHLELVFPGDHTRISR
ncbi:integrase [Salmonella enterica subsp. enterica]|nr:integrase [Salmonella enterica subsp. enterica]